MAPASHTRPPLPAGPLARHYDGFLSSLRGKKPETRGTYGRALREFVRWRPSASGAEISTELIRRYKRHLTSGRRLSAVSVSTYLTAVRRFCDYLVRRGVMEENPALRVSGNPRPRTHSRPPLTGAEAERLLAVVERGDERGARDYACMMLMLECGLSEIELIRADAADLEKREGPVILRVQGKGRSAKDQSVRVPPAVVAALDAYMAFRPGLAGRAPLFASAGNRTQGARMTTRGIRDRISRHLAKAGVKREGIDRLTASSLRHTAALLLAARGASVQEIRDRMRLGSVATARLYLQGNHHTDS